MFGKIKCLFFVLIVIIVVGCGDNQYYDEQLQMKIQQLDSDLDNRWSTTGVVVISPGKANLERGELISYVISEYPINSRKDYKRAIKRAMKKDNNFVLLMGDGAKIRIAVRRSGEKVGIDVDVD